MVYSKHVYSISIESDCNLIISPHKLNRINPIQTLISWWALKLARYPAQLVFEVNNYNYLILPALQLDTIIISIQLA